MEKTKLLTIAVVALLILNFCTLAFLWLRHEPPLLGAPKGKIPPAMERLLTELKFDNEQRAAFETLWQRHRSERDALQMQVRNAQEAFFGGLSTNDTTKIEVLTQRQRQLEMMTFKHLVEVRNLAKPNQQMKFDNLIEGTLREIGKKREGGAQPR